MLEVSKGIEGLAARLQRLESDGQELDETIKEKSKIGDKIDDLFNRIRTHNPGIPGPGRDSFADVMSDAEGSLPRRADKRGSSGQEDINPKLKPSRIYPRGSGN